MKKYVPKKRLLEAMFPQSFFVGSPCFLSGQAMGGEKRELFWNPFQDKKIKK